MKYSQLHKKIKKELEAIAFTRIADVCTWNEEGILLLPRTTIRGINTAAIAEIKEDTKGMHIKLHSKLKAIELLQKYTSYEEQQEEQSDILPPSIVSLLQLP